MLNLDDVKSDEDKMWLDGHDLAIQDVRQAQDSYTVALKMDDDMPKLRKEMFLEFVEEYSDYVVKFLKKQNRMMLSTILEDQ